MFPRILLIIMLTLSATQVFAEDAIPAPEDQETDQSDIYYNAMLRSIDLDKMRWKPFSRSMESGPWFYDTQSLKRHGKKISVMVTVFPHPQKTAMYRPVYREHSKIKKIVFETEINCAAHTYRQPQIQVYGYYKELLAEHTMTNNVFSSIKQGTTTDTLQGLICGPGKNKKH